VPKYSGKPTPSRARSSRRDDKPKYLNAAFSPYTVTLRFYKDDADKDAASSSSLSSRFFDGEQAGHAGDARDQVEGEEDRQAQQGH